MNNISEFMGFVGIAGMMAASLMMVRNHFVFKFREKIIQKVHNSAVKDINNGVPFVWRWEEFESVGYQEMVFKFWKPLRPEAFYKNTLFLE